MGKKIIAILLILMISISSLPMAIVEELEGAFVSSARTEFWGYDYRGYNDTWTAPYTGWYQINCYGAQGGNGLGGSGINGQRWRRRLWNERDIPSKYCKDKKRDYFIYPCRRTRWK